MVLTSEQIEVFAAGLYTLASSDGVDDSEVAVIREFVEEAGAPELMGRLSELHFEPASAYRILETTWLRKLFLQSAILLIQADGQVSDEERETLSWIAMAFGIPGGYEEVAASVAGQSIA